MFPPKGDPARDKIEIVRTPGDTRPLGLKDSGNKIVGTTYTRSLKPALAQGACPLQNGFTPFRQLVQNLVDLDSAARCFGRSEMASKYPLLASWDYIAAFPSVAHRWLRLILPIIGFPRGVVSLVRFM